MDEQWTDGRADAIGGSRAYRASVRGSESSNLRIVSPELGSLPEALAWQRAHLGEQGGAPSAMDRSELRLLIEEFVQAAEAGAALDPRGRPYTGETLRSLRGGLSYVDSELGAMSLDDVRPRDVQDLVAQLRASGIDPTRIVGVVDAFNALHAYAIRRDLVDLGPVVELELFESQRDFPDVNTVPPPFRAGGGGTPPSFSAWEDRRTPPPYPAGGGGTPPSFSAWEDRRTPPPYPAGGGGTPPPYPAGGGGTPPSFSAWGDRRTPPPFPSPNYMSGPSQFNGNGSGPFNSMFGPPGMASAEANYDATMQERWLWWTARIIVIVFVLIALVLVAESV